MSSELIVFRMIARLAVTDTESQVVDAPESLTVELQKDDVIRMLKGSNAPFGMAWDERAMQEQPISELMEIYAQLNWSDKPIEESEAPRIVLASA